MKEIKISIEGMKCEGCVNRINNVLKNIKGIENFEVSLKNKELMVKVKKDKIVDEIIEKIESIGFECTRK